ncbi:hypothetical protein HanIR_Chr17g0848971 [Helianthus annuus]|nr:hypothetical protein HanIR_Chr17g0848971 [Helianthus annuus]
MPDKVSVFSIFFLKCISLDTTSFLTSLSSLSHDLFESVRPHHQKTFSTISPRLSFT